MTTICSIDRKRKLDSSWTDLPLPCAKRLPAEVPRHYPLLYHLLLVKRHFALSAEPFHIVTSPWHVKHKMPFGCPAHKGLFSIVSKTSLWHFCLVVRSLTGAQGLASVPLGFWEGEIVPYFRLYTVPQPQAQIKRSGAAREGWSGVCWKPFCQVGRTFLVCASRVGKRQPFQPGGTRGPGYGRLDWICSCTEHICQGSGEMYAGAKYRIT